MPHSHTLTLDVSQAPHFSGPTIELRNFPIPIAVFKLIEAEYHGRRQYALTFEIYVKDRDSGEENLLVFQHHFPDYDNPDLMRRAIHGIVRYAMEHAGVRVHDPHQYEAPVVYSF